MTDLARLAYALYDANSTEPPKKRPQVLDLSGFDWNKLKKTLSDSGALIPLYDATNKGGAA